MKKRLGNNTNIRIPCLEKKELQACNWWTTTIMDRYRCVRLLRSHALAALHL
jgi:hypothetical protein